MNRNILLLFLCLMSFQPLLAQDKGFFNIEAGTGLLNYNGDIDTRFVYPDWEPSYSLGLSLGLDNGLGVRLQGLRGAFIANDRAMNMSDDLLTDWDNFDRALNVRTELYNVSFQLLYYLDNGYILPDNFPVSPYIGVGLGHTWFTPYGDLLTGDGDRYYYWSDNTVRLSPEATSDPDATPVVQQDGDFETDLSELETEGISYNRRALNIPVILGISLRLSNRLRLNLEGSYYFTQTDYLDDVSGDYSAPYASEFTAYAANPSDVTRATRGNPDGKKDRFYYTSVSLAYRFIWGGKKFKANKLSAPPAGYSSSAGPYTENQRLVRGIEEEPVSSGSRTMKSQAAPSGIEADVTPYLIQPILNRSTYSQRDTLTVLRDEVEKVELYNKWYTMRLNSPDPRVSYEAIADSTLKARKADSLFRADFPIMTLDAIEGSKKRKSMNRLGYNSDPRRIDTTRAAPSMVSQEAVDRRIAAYNDSIEQVEMRLEELRLQQNLQPRDADQMDRMADSLDLLQERYEMVVTSDQDSLREVRDSLESVIDSVYESTATMPEADTLDSRIDSLQQELEQARQVAEQADEDTAAMEEGYTEQIRMLEDSLARQQELRSRQVNRSERDSAALERYRVQVEELNRQIEQSGDEEEELQQQIEDLEDRLDDARRDRSDNRDNASDREVEMLEDELDRLRDDLRQERDSREDADRDRRRVGIRPVVEPVVRVGDGSGRERRRTRRELNALRLEMDSLERAQRLSLQTGTQVGDTATVEAPAQNAGEDSVVNARLMQLQQQMDSLQTMLMATPEEEPGQVEETPAASMELPPTSVYFRSGSFALSEDDKQRIRQLSAYASRNQDVRIALHGYTDATGNAQQNLILSQRRAASVQAELVKNGIRADRIEVEYFGVSPNLDSQASAYGRRVEILMQY
ncbi:MAG: OmpA family protein [Cyclobacteriaceae bacterium]